MRRAVTCCLAACLMLAATVWAAPSARAADVELVGMASMASYDQMRENLDLVAEMAGRPGLGKGAEGMMMFVTGGQGLKGIDKSRPWGVLMGTDGHDVGGCLFFPVKDFKALIAVVKQMSGDKLSDHGDGLWELEGPKQSVYVQETHPGWAFVVKDREVLEYVPANPAAMLEGLNKRYDMALRLYPARLPEHIRDDIAEKAEKHARKHAKHQPRWDQGDEGDREARRIMMRHIREQLCTLAGDLEVFTLGMKLDHDTKNWTMDVDLVCQEGSDSAEFLAHAADTKTQFGAFRLRGATFNMRATGRQVPLDSHELEEVLDIARKKIHKKLERKLEKEDDLDDAMDLVDEALRVVRKTKAEGYDDQALSVRLDPDAITLLVGRFVEDGPALEDVVKELVEELGERCDKVDDYVTLDIETCEGVNLHRIEIPLEECDCEKAENLQKLFGDRLTIVLGFGPKAAYVSAGVDAMQSLKRALRKSAENADKNVPPVVAVFDLGQFAESARHCPVEKVQAKGKRIAKQLEKADGDDRARLVVRARPNGLKARLTLQEGVLRAMATAKHRKSRD